MQALAAQLSALELIFQPWATAPQEPVIWAPELSDPNYQVKRQTIDEALWVLREGPKLLAGALCLVDSPRIDTEVLGETLTWDPERPEFLELARHCQQVMRAIPPYLLAPPLGQELF